MAVSFKGASNFAAAASAISLSVANAALGDIAILVVTSENQAISLTTANGFVELGAQANKAAGTAAADPASRLAVYWKRVTTAGTVSVTIADSGDNQTARIYLFSGCVEAGNPWDVFSEGNDSAANDTNGLIPGATTTIDNCLIFLLCSSSYNGTSTAQFSAWTNADLTGITENNDNTNTAGLGGGFGSAYGMKATAGTYAATTVNLAQTSYKGTMSIALKPELTPTVALNSPSESATTTDTTPSLQFTGTDGNSDTLEYQVQIHTYNNFGAFDIQSPVALQSEGYGSGNYGICFSADGLKQFIPGASAVYQSPLSRALDLTTHPQNYESTLSFSAQGSTGVGIGFWNSGLNFYVITSSNNTLFQYSLTAAHTFASGYTYTGKSLVLPAGCHSFFWKPDGLKLFVSNPTTRVIYQYALTVAGDLATATLEKTSAEIANPSSIKGIVFNNAGTKIILSDGYNTKLYQLSLGTAWDVGNLTIEKETTLAALTAYCALWINADNDLLFIRTAEETLKYEITNPLIKADSTTAAGFSDVTNSGDTHPFASGDQIDYTVQSALSAGTYYWRVRAKDTTGRNQWADWSTVRSLTIQSGQSLTAATGNFSFTGNAVNFTKGLVLSASNGNYVFSANAVNFRISLALALATGSFNLSGNDSLLKKAIKNAMQSGSYNMTGYPANFAKALKIDLQTGNFTLTGNQAALKKSLIQSLQHGSFVFTGNNAILIKSLKTALETGSLTLTGNNATFRKALILAASTGNFNLSGNDIALTKALKLAANSGSFALTGNDASFCKALRLSVDSGNFMLTGNQAHFSMASGVVSYVMQANSGNYTLTGNASNLRKAIKLAASTGNYTLTGNTITFRTQYATVSYVLHASSGSFSLTGNDIAFRKALRLAAEVGSFTITGNSVNFQTGHGIVSYTMQADTGFFTLNGVEICFKLALKLIAEPGSYELTGADVGTVIVFLKIDNPVRVKCPLIYEIRVKTRLTTVINTITTANTKINLSCPATVILHQTTKAITKINVKTKIQ